MALSERRERLLRRSAGQRAERLTAFLTDEVWPQVPAAARRRPVTSATA
jgi:hypothetical protein